MTTTSLPHQAAEKIQQLSKNFKPRVGMVLGSGLGALADSIQDAIDISYDQLPGFPEANVKGHTGNLRLGYLNGTAVACLQGRSHTYEDLDYTPMKNYIRTLKCLGCEIFIGTNASGSLRPEVPPGELVLINDHINFQPGNPLAGPNDDEFGTRFPPMDNAYDLEIQQLLQEAANQQQVTLHPGVYISVLGPNYETAAEIKAFKIWGADVIGMSTVPEVLVANHCGLRVGFIATVTNFATGLTTEAHDHNAVLIAAEAASKNLIKVIQRFCESL